MVTSNILDTSTKAVSVGYGAYSRLKSVDSSFLDLLIVSNLLLDGTYKNGQAWGLPCVAGIVLNNLGCRNDGVVNSYDDLAYILKEKQTARPNLLAEFFEG